jgi:hypothetical protein
MKRSSTIVAIVAQFAFSGYTTLLDEYERHHREDSDLNEHLPVLRRLASESLCAMEIGIRSIESTWGVLMGLSENGSSAKSYVGVDLDIPPFNRIDLPQALAKENGIAFRFVQVNDMKLDLIGQVDLLFIDSLHTYCHLRYELDKFSSNVNKYIALHDTSEPWGLRDDTEYLGDYSEYGGKYDCTKRGLWPAVEDFLAANPTWELMHRYENDHGLTVLRRR